ncbi:hypothetical protein MHBO_003378 [Bonamia ostreae]|uniref:RAE1/2 domain-containing protein n=1 Tax=Bonamia ostreae TaxID=126728 RepID=A0ABV2AQA4_9EUKA
MENFKRELDKYLAQRATEKQNLRKFEFEENQNFHKKIICKSLIIGSNSVPNEYLQIEEPTRQITRAVIISDKSLIGGTNSFVAVKPPKENLFSITIIQLSQDQFVSIENHYIIYMSTTYHENARKEISDLVNKIIKKENLKLFCFFEQKEKIINRNLAKNLKNVCLVDQSSCSIGFNASYRQAEELFAEMFPNKMFLEKRHCDSENEIKEELEEIDVMFEGEKTRLD